MKRLTISVPDSIAAKAQRAVDAGEAGEAESVSGYVGQLAETEPDWAAARGVIDALILESGPISAEDRAWALVTLGIPASPATRTV
jgi:hypothetical protein